MNEKNHYSPAHDSLDVSLVTVHKYNADTYEKSSEINACPPIDTNWKYWIQVKGLKNEHLVQTIGLQFGIHPLMIEDVLHTVQRPKIDEMEDSIFIVLKMYYLNPEIDSQQVSFFVKDNLVISFEEQHSNALQLLEKRLVDNHLNIRKRGEDYLLSAMLDVVIDRYLDVEEYAFSEIEEFEKPIHDNPGKQHFLGLIKWRKDLLQIKRNIAPLSDILHTISRANYSFFQKENKLFYRDLHDHILRVLDTLDMHRESVNSLLETYHAQVNNKMNEVMKTLTIMSSVFIPLTFIVGIYGMNFDNMPELRMHYGYFITLSAMAVIAVALLIYFRWKKYF